MEEKKKVITVAIPCYRSENNIEFVIDGIRESFSKHQEYDYQIVLANDGSPDHTFEEIRKLRSGGIRKRDIVVLSYYRMDNPSSCLFGVKIPPDIGPISFNPTGSMAANKNISYYTIKAFKGLESKAVIMVDVDSFSDQSKRLENYVGMSRARSYLVLLYDEKLYKERQERLLQSLIS